MDLAPGFEILNLGGAETTALRDLVRWLAEELDVEPRIEYQPDQPGDVPITYADVSKAGRLLGYSPKVPIREGLREFVRWYRATSRRSGGRAMKICVVGTGYVGLVTGACLADFGMQVVCVDKLADKIAALERCEIPIYEPGLATLVRHNVEAGTAELHHRPGAGDRGRGGDLHRRRHAVARRTARRT